MLKDMNEQVQKQQVLRDELVVEIEEIDKECAWLMDDKHPKKGATGFPNLIMEIRLQKRKSRLVKSLEERQRVLDGKVRRRDEWLSEKREVARRRIQKVRDRDMSVDDLTVIGMGVKGLDEAIKSTDDWLKFLVAKKELVVMVDEIFGGIDELRIAEPKLWEEVLEVF